MNAGRQLRTLVCGVLLAVAAGLPASAGSDLRLVGSDLLGPEFAAVLARYAAEHELTLQLDLAGTRPGIARLQAGQADLGFFALPPGEVPPGDPLLSRVIATQALVVIVPDAVPLTQITQAQLRGIFALGAGENVTNWGDLGLTGEWRGRAIVPFVPAPAAGLTLPLARRLLFSGAELKPTVVQPPTLAALGTQLLETRSGVALTPAVPVAGGGFRALAVAASLSEPALQPTPENLHGGYALRLPLYVTFRREATPRLLPLLRHLLGEEGAEALARAHFHLLPVAARNQLLFELEALR